MFYYPSNIPAIYFYYTRKENKTMTKPIKHTFKLTKEHITAILEYLNDGINDDEQLQLLNDFTDVAFDKPEHIAELLQWPKRIYTQLQSWSTDEISYMLNKDGTFTVTIVLDKS